MARKKHKYNERLELGYDASGRRVRRWIRADDAATFRELKRQAVAEFESDLVPAAVTVKKYAEDWKQTYKANVSIQTQQMYDVAIRKLQPVYGKKVSDLTMMDLQKILNSNSDHPRACEQLRLTIRQLCRQAVRDGILKRDISDGLQIPKCPKPDTRFLTSEEVEKILAIDFDEQDKLFIDVIYHTGMRPAEALALQWSDIDKKNNVIHVRRAFEFESNKPKVKTTKTGVSRDIPVTSSFTQMLLRRSKTSVFVFLCGDAPFTRSAYFMMSKRVFGRIKEEIGIEGVTFYTFRHTFATNLYYDGVKPGIITTKEAATICGHSEHIFLTRYTHLDDSRENIDELLKRMFG